MKSKQKKEKKVRKPNPIDWSLVENLLQADCSGTQIASYMGISNDTLYERTKKEKGMNFSLYSLKFKQKGDSILKAKQFESAITDKNITMQIWLGKQRLGQREKQEITGKDGKDLIPPSITEIEIIKTQK